MARFNGFLCENPDGGGHLIPLQVEIETGELFIRVNVPKEHPNFTNASGRLCEIADALVAANIQHKVLHVSSQFNNLPDCVRIMCAKTQP